MPKHTPRPRAGGREPAELSKLVDACDRLLRSQDHLVRQLRTAGLLADHTIAALLAREDQIEAAIADLRTRHPDPARGRTPRRRG